mgnify:FL=1
MQDLKALEGKNLAELREIARALGIENIMVKKRELIEKIAGGIATDTPADNKDKKEKKKEAPAADTPAETVPEASMTPDREAEPAPKAPRGRRPRITKTENTAPAQRPAAAHNSA